MSKPKPLAPGDIIEISYLHMPVMKKKGEMGKFSARIKALYPIGEYDPSFAHLFPKDEVDRRGWQMLHWEQRSANKSGFVTISAEGQNIDYLPRVRFVKRPK